MASRPVDISVIVPVYNEAKGLRKKRAYYEALMTETEVIFVDGGSTDETPAVLAGWARVMTCRKNRAAQMNTGAAAARGEVLLFLHADAVLLPGALEQARRTLRDPRVVGGCFSQVLDAPGWIFRWISWTGNYRARWTKVLYGDQGIFIRREVFERLHGFPEVSVGEDVLLSRRLRTMGRVAVLPDPIYCSARRWQRQGIWRTFWTNRKVLRALARGVSPDCAGIVYGEARE